MPCCSTWKALRAGSTVGTPCAAPWISPRHTRAADLYLLCAQDNGFLPAFYQSLGCQEVKRTSTHYAGLGILEMVLDEAGRRRYFGEA